MKAVLTPDKEKKIREEIVNLADTWWVDHFTVPQLRDLYIETTGKLLGEIEELRAENTKLRELSVKGEK